MQKTRKKRQKKRFYKKKKSIILRGFGAAPMGAEEVKRPTERKGGTKGHEAGEGRRGKNYYGGGKAFQSKVKVKKRGVGGRGDKIGVPPLGGLSDAQKGNERCLRKTSKTKGGKKKGVAYRLYEKKQEGNRCEIQNRGEGS